MSMFENSQTEMGPEKAAVYLDSVSKKTNGFAKPTASQRAMPNAAPPFVNAGFDATPITATVNPAPAPEPAPVETWFGELDETSEGPQQAAGPATNTAANTGGPANPLLNTSTANWNAIKAFMAAVVAWPGSLQDPGFVNLHTSFYMRGSPDGRVNGKFKVGNGKPFKEVDQLLSYANWVNRNPMIMRDAWFCTSLQSETETNKHGKIIAKRGEAFTLSSKCVFIDFDVDPTDADKYASIPDALAAMAVWRKKVGMPFPSAIVYSGYGVHVYWINNVALTPQQWWPFASGLAGCLAANNVKFDRVCTEDISRIMRMPGTFNHKQATPAPVTLEKMRLKIYDFEKDLAVLKPFANPPKKSKVATAKPLATLFADGVDPAIFKGGSVAEYAPLKLLKECLSDGLDKFEGKLVDPTPIFARQIDGGCEFFRLGFKNGGKDYAQPLWNQLVLCTTFMENGNAIAHACSKGHHTYTPDDTETMFHRKEDDRIRLGLGYPACSTIQNAGCKSCKACPLLSKGKSPLNIRPPTVTATVTNASSPSGSSGAPIWTGHPGISFSKIPHRKWLYGSDLVRGELTVIGSPGGAGKSSLAIGIAICASTGRELLGEKIRGHGLKALVINGEDSTDEIRRRLYAFSLAHGIAERDLHGLTAVGADDAWVQRISFLKTNEKGISALNQDGLDALRQALDTLLPDIIVLDPLVSFCAGGNMNDNSVMSSVMRKLKEIAAQYECAMLIVHHTRKGGDVGNVEAISGAAAITNLARRAIMPAPLTDDDIKKIGLPPSERPGVFKLVDAKSNLVPRAVDSPLYRLQSVELPNPEPPLYPFGDNVQAITRIAKTAQASGVVNADDQKIEAAILDLVVRGKEVEGQTYPYSPSVAGATNERSILNDATEAVVLATAPRKWHPLDLEDTVKTKIKKMQDDGRLAVEAMGVLMPKPGRFRKGRGLKVVRS
jgi:hypothetical protein